MTGGNNARASLYGSFVVSMGQTAHGRGQSPRAKRGGSRVRVCGACGVCVATLQTTRHAGSRRPTFGKPGPDNGQKEVVGPLEVQQAQTKVYGHEQHGPMPDLIGIAHGLEPQVDKGDHNGWIDKAANGNPREIKASRDGIRQDANLSLVDDASQNEKPRVDFHRQTSPHEPSVLGKGNGTKEIGYYYQVVLQTEKKVAWVW